MKAKRLWLNVWLAVLLLLTGALGLATGVSADGISFRGEYYNTKDLTGPLALVRDDPAIDFDWGNGSPSGVNPDQFSVRWTTFASFAGGNYTFYVTKDDGARLWIDGTLVIDKWYDEAPTTHAGTIALAAGYHSVTLEYYENLGQARIKLWWELGAGPITEWRGEYYTNAGLVGTPFMVRNDTAINFDWGYNAPNGSMPTDNFSVRWTRDVYFSAGTYAFSVTIDDGARVYVDGSLVLDKWYPQSRTTHSVNVTLAAGTHQIKVEYFEQGGVATCIFGWGTGGSPTPSMEVIVDDLDPGFVWGGSASSWYARAWGFRNHLFWTWNGSTTAYNWAKWNANLPAAGNWEVYVYVASKWFGSKSAKYQIYHAGVRNDVTLNQNIYSNQWISLGTFAFNGGAGEYVYLSDATGEAYATRFLGFDAIKFVKRDGTPGPLPPPPAPCAIQPILGFGTVWFGNPTVQAKLGCPAELEKGVWAAEESFQSGYMFWRADNLLIYVLKNNGTWQSYPDTWTSAEPEWDAGIVAPAGFYQPKRGFGKVWREQPGVRTSLGWATTEERGFGASVQGYAGGLMFWSNLRGTFVLYGDGTWAKF